MSEQGETAPEPETNTEAVEANPWDAAIAALKAQVVDLTTRVDTLAYRVEHLNGAVNVLSPDIKTLESAAIVGSSGE